MSSNEATDALSHLRIFHPYGTVGRLPWQGGNALSYGAEPGTDSLLNVVAELRTFSEGVDPDQSDIILIRKLLLEAERIAVLGFAFHRLNLELLFPSPDTRSNLRNSNVFATALNISGSDRERITIDLNARTGIPMSNIQLKNELRCADLFKEYWRSLSFF